MRDYAVYLDVCFTYGYSNRIKMAVKIAAEYKDVQTLPPVLASQQAGPAGPKRPAQSAVTNTGSAGPGVKLIGGPESGST